MAATEVVAPTDLRHPVTHGFDIIEEHRIIGVQTLEIVPAANLVRVSPADQARA